MPEPQTGFLIDGTVYEVPTMSTFTMDEAQILWDYSSYALEDFVAPENETDEQLEARQRMFSNPAVRRALMHIAYARGNRDVKPADVKRLIGEANVLEQWEHLFGGEQDEEEKAPLASTTAPQPPSPTGSVDSSDSSGASSENASDEPDDPPAPTGITRSATSSPASPRTELVS